MSIAVVTDSNSMLAAESVRRFGATVVAIPMTINGVDYLEGVDLDADTFYEFFAAGTPEVTTSQPSPGAFVEAYGACVAAGATEIISAHIMREISGTLNSARIAADMVDVPVHLVDTRTASFGIGLCVHAIGEALEAGADATAAVAAAEARAELLFSVSALGAADLLAASGRAPEVAANVEGTSVAVFRSGPGGTFDMIGNGRSEDEVCDLLAATMHNDGAPIRVALGTADASAAPITAGLRSRLEDRADVTDIADYRVGPSVGAVTGPGTAGGFWFAADA